MFNQTPVLLHTQQEFELQSFEKEVVLCLKNPKTSFSLVFFYGPDCDHCDTMRPIFYKNSGMVQDCSFIMVNLKNNHNLIYISQQTKTPIKYVPYILLYHKQLPLMEYSGKSYSDEAFRNWLGNAISHFTAVNPAVKAPAAAPAPKPLARNDSSYASFESYATLPNDAYSQKLDVCYLPFTNAYSP